MVGAALLTLVGAGSAWAEGGGAGANARAPVFPPAPTTPSSGAFVGSRPANAAPAASGGTTAAGTSGAATFNGNAVPTAPPSSLTQPPSAQGVPPTPAPATPGLPAPSSTTGALPSSQGLGAQVETELRPAPSLNAAQVADVQAALAAGGLYRGPIDGIMSGATRAAILQFQTISRIPATGELDGETMSRLSGAAAGAGVGANGSTSTVGNRSAAGDPFAISAGTVVAVPGTPTTSSTTTATPATPFQLTGNPTLSPLPPAGTVIQP